MDAKVTKDLILMLKDVPKQKLKAIYERHGIEPREGVERLIREVLLDGGNSFINVFRYWSESTIEYDEFLNDVAGKLSVKATVGVEALEARILRKIWDDLVVKMSDEDKIDLAKILGETETYSDAVVSKILGKGGLALALKLVGREIVAGLIKRMLLIFMAEEAGTVIAAEIAGAFVPGLNILLAAWTVNSIAGPAYRKTVPTAIEIALLRLEYGEEVAS